MLIARAGGGVEEGIRGINGNGEKYNKKKRKCLALRVREPKAWTWSCQALLLKHKYISQVVKYKYCMISPISGT